ncbi:MAG: dxr: 1-deoxy-d-xylulose 5-phosphate reductoisomerase, partial [Akkermansiaceae bacterium]|nr:dxr: 1-deoxy-d-xylulose 5-phosphate reductoisomerase [Akkermansiaceae bacterium]
MGSPLKDSAPRRKVVLLGSTGSIGRSTLEVARLLPERIEIVGLAAHGSVELLAEQVRATGVKHVALCDVTKAEHLRTLLPPGVTLHTGPQGLVEIATR